MDLNIDEKNHSWSKTEPNYQNKKTKYSQFKVLNRFISIAISMPQSSDCIFPLSLGPKFPYKN